MDIISIRTADAAVQLQAASTAESQSIHTDGRAVERERTRDVEHQHTAACPVPRGSRQGTAQRRGGILWHSDHLVRALPFCAGGGSNRVVVDQPAIDSAACDWNRVACDRPGRFDEFVIPRIIDGGKSRAGRAVAVTGSVSAVDAGILHLHDQQQVSGRNRSRRAARGAHGNRRIGGACGHTRSRRIVCVHHSGQRSTISKIRRRGARVALHHSHCGVRIVSCIEIGLGSSNRRRVGIVADRRRARHDGHRRTRASSQCSKWAADRTRARTAALAGRCGNEYQSSRERVRQRDAGRGSRTVVGNRDGIGEIVAQHGGAILNQRDANIRLERLHRCARNGPVCRSAECFRHRHAGRTNVGAAKTLHIGSAGVAGVEIPLLRLRWSLGDGGRGRGRERVEHDLVRAARNVELGKVSSRAVVRNHRTQGQRLVHTSESHGPCRHADARGIRQVHRDRDIQIADCRCDQIPDFYSAREPSIVVNPELGECDGVVRNARHGRARVAGNVHRHAHHQQPVGHVCGGVRKCDDRVAGSVRSRRSGSDRIEDDLRLQ